MKTGTIKQFKRKWPGLIRKAEKTTRLHFERRPILKVQQRRGGLKSPAASEFRVRARHPHVFVTKRLIREDPKLAEICASHELRELLFLQKGLSSRQSHLKSRARDGKGTAWKLRAFCGYGKNSGIKETRFL